MIQLHDVVILLVITYEITVLGNIVKAIPYPNVRSSLSFYWRVRIPNSTSTSDENPVKNVHVTKKKTKINVVTLSI
uniref:Uncharacterized protein n=1 Tax=Lepeophtheirus salmonis TaxID=72036 RepID=A0A0K2UY73_LEPSM